MQRYICKHTRKYTHTLRTPRNGPEAYHRVYLDCLALANTQQTEPFLLLMVYRAVFFMENELAKVQEMTEVHKNGER